MGYEKTQGKRRDLLFLSYGPMVQAYNQSNIVVRCESCIVQHLKVHNTNVSYVMTSILFLSKRGT